MSIELQGITKLFGDFTALQDVQLSIATGKLVALLGPSGSGKTTLLRSVSHDLRNPLTAIRGTAQVLGRRLLAWFEVLLERVPLVKTIYGGIKIFIAAFQTKPEGVERVVLIDFPSPQMKTIGFVTRTLIDEASGVTVGAGMINTGA